MDFARDVYRTKRRDAEFAEKNAEKKEELIEKTQRSSLRP